MDLPASHVWLPEGIIYKSLRVHQQLVNWSFGFVLWIACWLQAIPCTSLHGQSWTSSQKIKYHMYMLCSKHHIHLN